MPRTTRHAKEENFNFRVSADLKAAFKAASEAADRPAAQILRDFMRAYVEQHGEVEPDYDAWFRRQVQAAIDDPPKPSSRCRSGTDAGHHRPYRCREDASCGLSGDRPP